MASGLSATLWSMKDMAEMIDANLPKPGKRGPYKNTHRNVKTSNLPLATRLRLIAPQSKNPAVVMPQTRPEL
jgi:hypothetical protein